MITSMSTIFNEDCISGMKNLVISYGRFVDTVITSPPYAEQRKHQYGGVRESNYPEWTVEWMRSVREVLSPQGSVFINIRPHIKNGQISDYVAKTVAALRGDGWFQCEDIVWVKTDSPPLGSIKRPRRSWETIYWFSQTNNPYVDCMAGGRVSNRIGFENNKFEHGGKSHIHAGQSKAKEGRSRVPDVIFTEQQHIVVAGTSRTEKGFSHTAMFPLDVPEYLINLGCPKGGIVIDPFVGSGTTARAAVNLSRGFVGFEIDRKNYEEAIIKTRCHIVQAGKREVYRDIFESSWLEDDLDLII